MKSSTKIFILTVVAFLIGSALTYAIMQLVLNPEVQQSIANEKEVSYDTDSNQSPSKFNSISELDEKAEPAVVIYQNVEDEPERIQALLKDFQEKEGFASINDFQHVGNLISFSAFFDPGGTVYLLMDDGVELKLIYGGQEPPDCSELNEQQVPPESYRKLVTGAFKNGQCFATDITGDYSYFDYSNYTDIATQRVTAPLAN